MCRISKRPNLQPNRQPEESYEFQIIENAEFRSFGDSICFHFDHFIKLNLYGKRSNLIKVELIILFFNRLLIESRFSDFS